MTSTHPLRPEPDPDDRDFEPDLLPEAGDDDWQLARMERRYVDYLEREIA